MIVVGPSRTPEQGAATTLNCAVNPELNSQTALYYDSMKVVPCNPDARYPISYYNMHPQYKTACMASPLILHVQYNAKVEFCTFLFCTLDLLMVQPFVAHYLRLMQE